MLILVHNRGVKLLLSLNLVRVMYELKREDDPSKQFTRVEFNSGATTDIDETLAQVIELANCGHAGTSVIQQEPVKIERNYIGSMRE